LGILEIPSQSPYRKSVSFFKKKLDLSHIKNAAQFRFAAKATNFAAPTLIALNPSFPTFCN